MASRLANTLARTQCTMQQRLVLQAAVLRSIAGMPQFSQKMTIRKAQPATQVRTITYNDIPKDMGSIQKICSKLSVYQKFNLSAIVMGAGLPVAWVLAPSILTFPIDLALGVAIPYHMAHGVGDVAADYAPMHLREMAKKAIYLISILVAFGFLKINLCGPGITMSMKSLWKKPAAKKTEAAAASI